MSIARHSDPYDLHTVIYNLFRKFDIGDIDGFMNYLAPDVQCVDDIVGKWLRGKDAVGVYFADLISLGMTNIHTSFNDFVMRKIGSQFGLATMTIEQSYVLGDEARSVTAPTTIALRRDDVWLVVLIHSVPCMSVTEGS